eukprot:356960-Chlamydomonas_euryale.AAC.2
MPCALARPQVDTLSHTSRGMVTEQPFAEPLREASPLATLNERQFAAASLPPNARTMGLWRKLNPGCMQSTIKATVPTNADTYRMRDGLIDPALDKARHRQKTDFSHYIEAAKRHVPRD